MFITAMPIEIVYNLKCTSGALFTWLVFTINFSTVRIKNAKRSFAEYLFYFKSIESYFTIGWIPDYFRCLQHNK